MIVTCCFLAPGNNNDPDNDDGDAAGDGWWRQKTHLRIYHCHQEAWLQREVGVRATLKLNSHNFPWKEESKLNTRLGPGVMPHLIRASSFQVECESQKEMEPNPCADTPFEWKTDSMLKFWRSQISSLHFRPLECSPLSCHDVFRNGIVCLSPLDHSFP